MIVKQDLNLIDLKATKHLIGAEPVLVELTFTTIKVNALVT